MSTPLSRREWRLRYTLYCDIIIVALRVTIAGLRGSGLTKRILLQLVGASVYFIKASDLPSSPFYSKDLYESCLTKHSFVALACHLQVESSLNR